MNRTISAISLCLLMVMMPLAGCVSDGTDGVQGPEGPQGPPGTDGADGSSLHLVVAESDLPECNGDLQGQIFFVSSDGAFQVCSTMGWSVVDLTGPAGIDGTNGTDGQDGSPGANGADGADGADGTNGTDGQDGSPGANGADGADGQDGLNGTNGTDGQDGTDGLAALAVTTTLSAGSSNSNCPDGGVQIDVGVDDNDNGVLDSSEIDQTTYICNGADGSDGADGQDGADGADGSASPNTMLTSISSPSFSLGCTAGGRVINQGLDNGDGGGTSQNGILESGEVDYTTTYCSKYVIWHVYDIWYGLGNGNPGNHMEVLVGDTIYFDADNAYDGYELWAHDTSNHSTWQVADINSFSGADSYPGKYGMEILVGDTIYFSANNELDGHELWAHDTSNHSTWQVADINNGGSSFPGEYMAILVGDTIYFDADDGNDGIELWAHDTSNHSTWQVADISSGGSNSDSEPGYNMEILVGDTIYFDSMNDVNGTELWAHDTSNHSTWLVADINSGSGSSMPGNYMEILVGDTIYFSAWGGVTRYELWAHDTSNSSTWMVADINSGSSSSPGYYMEILVGDTIYFDADDGSTGYELWAHDTSNSSTWMVADIRSGGSGSSSSPGFKMEILVGDTIYFDAYDASYHRELWAHDTSNSSTWMVADIRSGSSAGSDPGKYMEILVGDTIYFSAKTDLDGHELWAHDISNSSTWQVSDINDGSSNSNPGYYMGPMIIDDTIYFDASGGDHGRELWAMKIEHSIYY